ncbi:hypothetical protein D3C73_1145800 [compost metagenome]
MRCVDQKFILPFIFKLELPGQQQRLIDCVEEPFEPESSKGKQGENQVKRVMNEFILG